MANFIRHLVICRQFEVFFLFLGASDDFVTKHLQSEPLQFQFNWFFPDI